MKTPEESANVQDTQVHSREQSFAWTVTLVLGVLILIPSMLGFVMKFMEFAKLAEQTSGGAGLVGEGAFAVTPIVNYVCASAGFLLLLLWAAVNGMFRDLEHPKYAMLLNEKELDADV
ncbi:MAG: hypothetical protein ACKO2P_19275 [Planctomycetota bacterium]